MLLNTEIHEIELELTGTCNLDCPLCSRNNPAAQHLLVKNHRPVEEIIKTIETYPNLKRICIAGIISEPTLYKDFKRLIQYIGIRDLEVELYTNASAHDKFWWSELGEIFPPNIKIYFTVCGSTQELHERYRKGSNLSKLLDNAKSFKDTYRYKNDYIQHIKFNYNLEDFHTEAMQNIIKLFNNSFLIESLPYNERFQLVNTTDFDMPTNSKTYERIKWLGKGQFTEGRAKVQCKSIETNFLSIDQFGNATPCFLYRMYKGTTYTPEDAKDIANGNYRFCFECEKTCTALLNEYNLERMA